MKNIKKYYDKRTACQVLGCLMLNPRLVNSKEYQINIEDFMGNSHKALFECIYNLAQQGVQSIGLNDIETFMYNYKPINYTQMFEKNNSEAWIVDILEDANEHNYKYYYTEFKKLSLLRSYINEGIDVSEILDLNSMDIIFQEEQLKSFEKKSIKDIISFFDKKNLKAKSMFVFGDESSQRKAGDNAEELREEMKQSPSYGLNTESQYLNTVTRGFILRNFILETRDTGTGKTRIGIKRLLDITAPYIWSFEENDFVENPNGMNNAALYLGTEMDIYKELEPMMWAFVSGVDEKKIKDNELTKEEDARVDKAIEILKHTKLFLKDEANYDVTYLWNIVEEYKIKHNICAVAIDYLELTSAMTAEYVEQTRGMGVREDQILLNLSSNIKNIAKEFNVCIIGFTQTTDEARRDGVRDQRAVKGARSLPNKVDVGIVTFEPTKKEMQMIEPIIHKLGLTKHKEPNICYTIYKNRGNDIKSIKIWGYQDLGNMYYHDMFCTNKYYEPINIKKTLIHIDTEENENE